MKIGLRKEGIQNESKRMTAFKIKVGRATLKFYEWYALLNSHNNVSLSSYVCKIASLKQFRVQTFKQSWNLNGKFTGKLTGICRTAYLEQQNKWFCLHTQTYVALL